MQLFDLKPARRWSDMTREEFDLLPGELATLVAIVAFTEVEGGTPMPREELERALKADECDGMYLLDMTAPGRLWRKGLIELHGYREQRSYTPTAAGKRRVRQ